MSRDQIQQLLDANKSLLVYFDEMEKTPISDSSVDLPAPAPTGDRLLCKDRYRKIRLLLANYGVPHDSMLRNSYFANDSDENLDQALFGWFDSGKFRSLAHHVKTN